MSVDILKRVMLFVVLCLAQAVAFNNIHLFHCATPLVYVYFVLTLQRRTPRWAALLWGFGMGMVMDMFTDTPGVATASMTLIGMIQPPLLEMFLPRNADDRIRAAANTLGWGKFMSLAFIIVNIYCVVFFTIETFTFADFSGWLTAVVCSTLLTLMVIVAFESVRK